MTIEEHLQKLPEHDLDAAGAERVRQRVQVALSVRRPQLGHSQGWSWYHRLVEPAVLIGMGLSYLLWTVHDTVALFR